MRSDIVSGGIFHDYELLPITRAKCASSASYRAMIR
jgi:hypothetical protein